MVSFFKFFVLNKDKYGIQAHNSIDSILNENDQKDIEFEDSCNIGTANQNDEESFVDIKVIEKDSTDDNNNEVEISNKEMAATFQEFRKLDSNKNEVTFRNKKSLDISDDPNGSLTIKVKELFKNKGYDPMNKSDKRIGIDQKMTESRVYKNYDDKWSRILKVEKRRRFQTGKKYQNVPTREWNANDNTIDY